MIPVLARNSCPAQLVAVAFGHFAAGHTRKHGRARLCLADDPGHWFEDAHYYKPVDESKIVIFRNDHGFALVKILKVQPRTPESNAELRFAYELRYT